MLLCLVSHFSYCDAECRSAECRYDNGRGARKTTLAYFTPASVQKTKKSFMIFLPEWETGFESTLGCSWSTSRCPCFQTDWRRTGNILSGYKNQVSEMIFIPEHQM